VRSLVRIQLAPRHADSQTSLGSRRRGCSDGHFPPAAGQLRDAAASWRLAAAGRSPAPLMQALILGAGAVGARVARQLLVADTVDRVVLRDTSADRLAWASRTLGDRADIQHHPFPSSMDADVVVVASPRGTQLAAVRAAVAAGRPTVTILDDLAETVAILGLQPANRQVAAPVVVGAGFCPGLSCVLAAHGMAWFDEVEELHVAKMGTGGPACALVHHRALSRLSYDWRGDNWVRRPGGSGRELYWFPEPVGPHDCYRAALPDPILLHHAFPSVERITIRMAATRRDRLTAPLPMLIPPHAEGGSGAIRVELRGRRGSGQDMVVLGTAARPAVAAAAVAALTVEWALAGRLLIRGMAGLAEMVEPVAFLAELSGRGVKSEIFEGDHAIA
ncbi:uncharacterized protein METZ01_LOCUS148203, partial [marine metagenome]